MINSKIGNNLKALREALGFNQKQVADFLDIEREMISYYENGNRVVPIPVLMKLSDFFGISLKELLEENAKQSKLNEVFAFRATDISKSDFEVISKFKRIARHYIESKEKLKGV